MKFIRIFVIGVFLSLFCSPFLSAQLSGEKTVLWKISGNGLAAPSYLFGTIHVMPSDLFTIFPEADEELKQSEQLILEMVMDVPLATQIEWAKMMILPHGENLESLLPEEQFRLFKEYVLDSLQIKEKKFERYLILKPFSFYSALIPEVIGRKLESYEMHYTKIARKMDIPVLGLETFEFQLAIFDSIPVENQIDLFFGEQSDMKKEFADMIRMYEEQDIYEMAEELKEENEAYGDMEYKLVIQRNHNWAGLLSEWIKEKPSFIAVGAGHLAGENGLIRLLRENGFDVDPVKLGKK